MFQFVTLPTGDHEFVIGRSASTRIGGRRVRRPSRLITSIATVRTGSREPEIVHVQEAHRANHAAAISPGVARRFPFFAALRTRRPVFCCAGDGAIGETSNDHQSRRARGVDSSHRAARVFGRRELDGSGLQRRRDEVRECQHREEGEAGPLLQAIRSPQTCPDRAEVFRGENAGRDHRGRRGRPARRNSGRRRRRQCADGRRDRR